VEAPSNRQAILIAWRHQHHRLGALRFTHMNRNIAEAEDSNGLAMQEGQGLRAMGAQARR